MARRRIAAAKRLQRCATLLPFCVLTLWTRTALPDLASSLGPEPTGRPPVVAPRKQAWEHGLGGREAARPHLRERLRGWPSRLLVDRRELPRGDDDLLRRLARDTWRGLDALSDRESGLPIDHLSLPSGSLDPRDARIGDYASPTNIGLYLAAIAAARDLGFLAPDAALARAGAVLDTLDGLEQRSGSYFNFYDTTTLERTSDFVSFVDSTWLAAGLIVTRQSFPELAARCSARLDVLDTGVFYDRRAKQMIHGYFVDPLRRSPYHYGMLFTEARLGSLIAIGKGDVPREHWYAMARTAAPQHATRAARRVEAPGLLRIANGWVEWGGPRFVPSWGGSMFEALMPTLVIDERRWAPASLGRNGEAHVEIQRRYAREVLGYPVWGMSPSWSPTGERYAEYGVRPLGARPYGTGAVTPHAAVLALAVAPDAAVANLRQLATDYDLYGEYGFYDAVDPHSGAVAHTYLALDQSMILLALANHLLDGVVQKRFAADPILRAVLPLLATERFLD